MSRPPAKRGSVAARFRSQIEAAEAEGAALDDMTLRLTLSDATHLKRDPAVAVTDISFTDGVMRFLGVKIEQGGVTDSSLERA